jgi:hypothetical protein
MAGEITENNMAINPAGTLPPELFAQQQQLNRQQQMAQLLMQQGQQQPQGQMVSGRFVPTSFFQNIAPLVQTYMGSKLAEKGDKKALDLAAQLRQRYSDELQQFRNLQQGSPAVPEQVTQMAGPYGKGVGQGGVDIPMPTATIEGKAAVAGNPLAANLYAANAYNPALQALGMKKLTEGPKWEKAELPNPDGSIRKGWVDYNASNPLATFVEGGTKPAFTSLEAARFYYDTGMRLPTGAAPSNQPANAPMNMPAGGTNVQGGGGNMPSNAMPSGSMLNQPPTGGGMNMSPAAMSNANKEIFVDVEKRRRENLENSPKVLATINDTLRNVDDLIGDARIIKDSKGKEKIDYTITKDGKQIQGRKPQAGFDYAVGAGLPKWAVMGGSDTAGFLTRLDQIKDKTFLQAFESLKGGGQITQIEGEKATSALNRMNTAQSEVEFIKAAREFEENLRTGMELAKKKAGLSTGGTAKLRWNPNTNSWE